MNYSSEGTLKFKRVLIYNLRGAAVAHRASCREEACGVSLALIRMAAEELAPGPDEKNDPVIKSLLEEGWPL